MTYNVMTWNTKVGRSPAQVVKQVRAMASEFDVDWFLFQEAAAYIPAFQDMRGWDVIAARGQGEARGNPMLVRSKFQVQRHHAIRCEHTWTGPKHGNHHRGRVFTHATIEGIRFIDVHRTRPGWSNGGVAFREEYEKLLAVGRKYEDDPIVYLGDQNIGTRKGGDRGPNTPWALAEALDGRIITTTQGHIDYAVTRGITGKARRLQDAHGSDHHPVLLTLSEGNRKG